MVVVSHRDHDESGRHYYRHHRGGDDDDEDEQMIIRTAAASAVADNNNNNNDNRINVDDDGDDNRTSNNHIQMLDQQQRRRQDRHRHHHHRNAGVNTDIVDDDDDDDDNLQLISKCHYRSTAAMCLCTFTHSWLLVSVFPYSGYMVISLVSNTDTENAGPYAGLLAATFMIGRAVTSLLWGRMGDTYGRRIVLFLSLCASSVFSVLFGLSTSFGLALLWRFLLGASNGIAGISKAIVSETARGHDVLETRGMSLSMGMWAWGFLLSPAVAGFVSDPIRQYP